MKEDKHSGNSVEIGGDVEDSTVIVGNHNTVTNFFNKTEPQKLVMYSIATVLGLSLIIIPALNSFLSHDRSYMGGQLNIVVEPFLEEKRGRLVQSEKGVILANYFYSQLNNEIASGQFEKDTGIKAEIRGPQAVPPWRQLYGINPDIAAHRTASQINAHIVIYGVITNDEFERPHISIRFYASPDQFGDAQEILGENELGNPILLTGNLQSGMDLEGENEELRNRVQVVALLMKAIGAYVGEDFSRSIRYLEYALADHLWKQTSGREVLYLLAGNVVSRQALPTLLSEGESRGLEMIRDAEECYKQAIQSARPKGDYARAYIGLAGVQSFYAVYRARLSANLSDIDMTALERAEGYLDKALAASYQPPSADIPEKVAFNRAQVFLLRYQLSNDPAYIRDAESNYKHVLTSYASGKPRVRELAAHSHSGLALIARSRGEFENAIQEYTEAFKITRIPSLQAMYLYHIGNVYYDMADYENALKYYTSSLEMRTDLEKRISVENMTTIEERINEIKIKLAPGKT